MKNYSRTNNAAIINAYLVRCAQYPLDHYQRLLGLAGELAHDDYVTLEPPMATHYVYVYLNPLKPGKFQYTLPSGKTVTFDHEPFYIGKGKNKRAYNHLAVSAQNSPKNNLLRKIAKAGLKPIIKISASRVSDRVAQAAEINLILGVGRRDQKKGPLTNLTDGGEGMSGHTPTAATKAKMRASHIGRPHSKEHTAKVSARLKGRKLTDEHRAKLSAAKKGRTLSAEHKAKIAAAGRGRKCSAETREKIAATKIGKKRSPEVLAKISAARKGKPWSAARRAAQTVRK